MPVIADTHVHLYPRYDAARFLASARRNLTALAGSAADVELVLCLAERHDCHVFHALAAGATVLPAPWTVVESSIPGVLAISEGDPTPIWLIPGRQIVTSERLEVLALTMDLDLEDGRPAVEVIDRVLDAGGVPVVAWAPGKWFGVRGRVVSGLLDRYAPGRLVVGDSSLRPTLWLEPRLMRRAEHLGLSIIAGSDPLPIDGEEARVGTYGVRIDTELDRLAPVASLRSALHRGSMLSRVGRRGGVVETVNRLRGLRAGRS